MIEVENLTKYYGNFMAIEDVSFTVEPGEILGFLGPNGAGKTTTMRILTGFMPPTSGVARISGYDVFHHSMEARRRIGYLPETVPLYTDMTVRDYLDFSGALRDLRNPYRRQRIETVIARMHLEEYADTIIAKLSKGFRQRVGVAQAILHEPEVLILDEPTIGIDPIQVVETRQLIKELGKDHTIILSTHILPEVSMVCERVIIINEGRLVAVDRPENLSARLTGSDRLKLVVRGPAKEVLDTLRQMPGVESVEWEKGEGDGTWRYTLGSQVGRDLREDLVQVVVEKGWGLLELQPIGLSLEEIFLQLTTREEAGESA